MFDESDEASLGVVIHNPEGEVMAALLEKIHKPPSVLTLNLLAARQAVYLPLKHVSTILSLKEI